MHDKQWFLGAASICEPCLPGVPAAAKLKIKTKVKSSVIKNCFKRATETDLPQVHEFSLQLAQNLAASLIEEPIIRSDVPAGVALVVNRKNGRYIVHMLNNLLDPILFSDSRRGLVVLSGLTFAINQKRTGPIHRVLLSDGRAPADKEQMVNGLP